MIIGNDFYPGSPTTIKVRDSEANYIFQTIGESPNLIGYKYNLTLFHKINAILIKDAMCETDLHYFERKAKPKIPKGTEVTIKAYWSNFYGAYFVIDYDGKTYDIATSNVKITTTTFDRDLYNKVVI